MKGKVRRARVTGPEGRSSQETLFATQISAPLASSKMSSEISCFSESRYPFLSTLPVVAQSSHDPSPRMLWCPG